MKLEKISCLTCGAKDHSLFHVCSAHELEKVDANKVCNRYKKGQVLFFEGNNPMGLFCIYEGTIKVYKTSIDGKEQILRIAGPGDFLGYRALIADESYSASAEALEEVIACYVPKESFMTIVKDQPNLNQAMMRALCHDLGIANERLMNMAQKSVRERLAETLLILLETNQRNHSIMKDGQEHENICVQLPREDIANLTGSSTETIIRLLTEFKEDGYVALQGKKIEVLNKAALQRTARLN